MFYIVDKDGKEVMEIKEPIIDGKKVICKVLKDGEWEPCKILLGEGSVVEKD